MSYDTYQVFAASYRSKDGAESDFDAVEAIYDNTGLMDTYDAAILTRKDGKVKIVRKREQAEHTDGWEGAGIGLALGAVCALFPAVTLATGALAGAVAGGAIGVLAGHFNSGVSRDALRDLGEALDEGEYGLLVITATDKAKRVRDAMKAAVAIEEQQLKADYKAIRKELKQIGNAV